MNGRGRQNATGRLWSGIVAALFLTLPLSLPAQSGPTDKDSLSGTACGTDYLRCKELCNFKPPLGSPDCEAACANQRQICCGDEKSSCKTACRLMPTSNCLPSCDQVYDQCIGDAMPVDGPGGGIDGWAPAPKPYLPDAPGGPIPPLSNRPSPPWLEEIKRELCRCVNASELVFTENGAGVQWNGKKGHLIVGAGGCLEDQRMFCQVGFSF